jgi:membrane protease YdiL (CAAX protease family)
MLTSMPPILKALLPAAVIWVAGYVIYFVGSNAWMHWRGPWDFTIWHQQTLWTSAFRVAGVGVLGPIAEELLFRGLFYGKLQRMHWSTPVAVIVPGVAWGLLHASYGVSITLLILGGGILLGTARATTRSAIVPVLMHIAWNLYAVW